MTVPSLNHSHGGVWFWGRYWHLGKLGKREHIGEVAPKAGRGAGRPACGLCVVCVFTGPTLPPGPRPWLERRPCSPLGRRTDFGGEAGTSGPPPCSWPGCPGVWGEGTGPCGLSLPLWPYFLSEGSLGPDHQPGLSPAPPRPLPGLLQPTPTPSPLWWGGDPVILQGRKVGPHPALWTGT